VNISQEKLDALVGEAFRTNSLLLQAESRLRQDRAEAAATLIETARRGNSSVVRSLVWAGAQDPAQKVREEQRRERQELGLPSAPVKEVPLSLLSSPSAQEYAEAIRAAAEACRKMEEERGIEDGLAEILGDYAEIAALEVYGPVGLRGLE
jgi:type IV pilus biogenesis protein CpaD/CtpE